MTSEALTGLLAEHWSDDCVYVDPLAEVKGRDADQRIRDVRGFLDKVPGSGS